MYVTIAGCTCSTSLTGKAVAELLGIARQAGARKKILLNRLELAFVAKNSVAIRNVCDELFADFDAKLSGVLCANSRLPLAKRSSLEDCLETAKLLTFDSPLPYPVAVFTLPKKGGFRAIQNPGLFHRAGQTMVKWVLERSFKPRSFQFSMKGVPSAIEQVRCFVNQGYVWPARLDIASYYASFDPDEVRDSVPCGKEVMNVAVGREMNLVREKGSVSLYPWDEIVKQARLGLPNGAVSSPIVASLFMSKLSGVPAPGIVLVIYVDDFLLLAKSEASREHGVAELIKAVGGLPGGNFSLLLKEQGPLSQGVTFLGHRVQLRDEVLTITPTEAAVYRLDTQLLAADDAIRGALAAGDIDEARQQLANYQSFLLGWVQAFKACDDLSDAPEDAKSFIDGWCGDLGTTPDALKKLAADAAWAEHGYNLAKGTW